MFCVRCVKRRLNPGARASMLWLTLHNYSDYMSVIRQLYGGAPALLTDLYQLTMAYAHWRAGDPEREAVFHLFFRVPPLGGSFAIAAGLDAVVEYLLDLQFSNDDLDYLAQLRDSTGQALFAPEFLQYLGRLRFTGNLDAVPEGTAVFAQEPILRIRAPILQAQLLETALLNLVNYATLVATKAARIAHVANDDPVMDFGLRKAHGIDGGITGARAAYLGGVDATANVLAGKLFGIPVKGTHAHGWVMAFASELEAFEKYAQALPNNCIFLVDTYNSIQGVKNAIITGRKLRAQGHEMVGIRLDSGDLGTLAQRAREMLDAAGFQHAKIAASSSLDEHKIAALKRAGAPIDLWGVGTQLATGQPDASLDGVYKLAAIRDENGDWQARLKLSDSPGKQTTPGVLQVRRYTRAGQPWMDVIFDQAVYGSDCQSAVNEAGEHVAIPEDAHGDDLLQPVINAGVSVCPTPALTASRAWAKTQFARFIRADNYTVALESRLAEQKRRLQAKERV